MATLQSYITQVQTLVNDTSGANFTTVQMTNFVNAARQRVSLDTHCIRTFYQNLNTITNKETYIYNGTIGGVNLLAGGSGYTTPTVGFTGGGGSGAAAAATVVGGVITGITMTNWGTGYTSAPTLSITDANGSGASAVPVFLNNILDLINVSIIWGNQRQTCDWLEFTRFQAWFRAYTANYGWPAVFCLYQSQNLLYLYRIPDQPYMMEFDAINQSTDLVNLSDSDTQIALPYADAVQFYGAFLALRGLQDQRASEYYDGKGGGLYETRIKQFPAQTFSRRIFNPYYSGVSRLRRM